MPRAPRGSTIVLGGSGVAGTGIVAALLDADVDVDVIDLQPPSRSHPRLRFIEADLRDDATIEGIADYEHVVVAFGLLARGLSEQPDAALRFNLDLTLRVAQAARRGACRRFVFLSSAMVYDRTHASGALSEDAAVRGRCLYTHSKLAVEHTLHCAVAAGLPPTLILRPFTIFGPGPLRGAAGHLIGRWLELAAAGEALTIYGDGTQTVDLVPSAVLGAACVRLLEESEPPPLRVLNGTCGQPLSIGALADLFRASLPGVRVCSVEAPQSSTPSSQTWGDGCALQAYLATPLPDPARSISAFLRERAATLD